ncbi:hypothetical protein [Roseburia sp. MSJ-14]|uniref:hypothetical protein n=1 Tax=Roseburia sp. MSJ-14 TaxID=2841514 RepID=UPI001C101D25|nr:hypothetical protein [Roseburia sp. MSJ-14]MBU5472481.1 hypothetical protein [Roseburia sp. MSJ-14]
MKRDFSQEKIEELWSEATESCSVYLKSLANITDLEELGLPEVVVNIKISERYVEQLEEKEVLTINKLAEIITNVKEVDKTYAGYLKTLNEQLEAYGRKVQALTEMLQPEKLSMSNGSYMRELLAIGREYQEAANNSELIKVEIWLTPGHKMSEEEIAEAQEVLDRYFAEGTEAERRFFADEYTLMEELAEDDWSDAEWRRYQLMSALYTKLDSIRSVTTGAIEGVPFCGNLFEWSARTQARVRGYQFEELCSMENIFINSHTQHPYATFVGNMTGGLLTYNMASSVAGHIPGLAQRIGGWSERLSTFPILRRIGQDHLSNIIGATIVDTGAFTVPKAIIDIYNGESSETVFRNAGVDIGRNVLFNIFGEAVSGAVGRVVQRFNGGLNSVDDIFIEGKKAFNNFDIDNAYVKPKHLSTTGGNGQKFIGASKAEAECILKDALSNGKIVSITDNGLTKSGNVSYEIVIDALKTVGTKGEHLVKIVISSDGGMLSAYPIK